MNEQLRKLQERNNDSNSDEASYKDGFTYVFDKLLELILFFNLFGVCQIASFAGLVDYSYTDYFQIIMVGIGFSFCNSFFITNTLFNSKVLNLITVFLGSFWLVYQVVYKQDYVMVFFPFTLIGFLMGFRFFIRTIKERNI